MKLGIIGSGFIAQEVIPHFKDWGIDAPALCTTPRSYDKAKELAAANGIGSVYLDYDEMLSAADIDTVYVATPNFLHFEQTKKAIGAGKNVIVEKPITSNDREAKELAALAKEQGVLVFEAITTLHLANYAKIKEWLPRIGTVKVVTTNYSQYSRRYDAFKRGEILPTFDPSKSGGALMDINIYNLHYIVGLFGKPGKVGYLANVERGIDTSGIVTMEYDGFKAVAIGAKDCGAPTSNVIQGTDGYIFQDTPAGRCEEVVLRMNDGSEERYNAATSHRMEEEFKAFRRAIDDKDFAFAEKLLAHSIAVSEVQTLARRDAGVVFPSDRDSVIS